MKKLKNPLVSVVIPTYNEEKDIEECIRTLLMQSYKNIEIIIVDDGSTDKTKEIVGKFKKVKLIQGEHKGPGFSRNLGAKHAKGKILIFVDADMYFDKDYVKNLTKPVIDGKTMGTEERYQKASNTSSIWSRCWGSYVTENRFGKSKKGIVFRSILREKFFEMGCFDPQYGYADDLTFLIKHKERPDIAENAICYHKNPSSPKEIFKQSKWIGSSLYVHYPPLDKKYLLIPILIMGTFSYIPLSVYIFLKKILKNTFKPKNPLELLYLLSFGFIRTAGTFKGVLIRNISGKNYR